MSPIRSTLLLACTLALAACAAPGSTSGHAVATPASSLDTVMQRGELRACLPGDYKPFGFQ
ncbi:MAG: ArtI protein, partial [Ottowia sp.]|nr:ArtI protein [Ottowia sp.]